MRRFVSFFLWGSAFVFFTIQALASENTLIRISLFQGTWGEGQAGFKEVVILSESSIPQLASLKSMIDDPEYELKAGIIDMLMDVLNLPEIDDVFSFAKFWNGIDPIPDERFLADRVGFRFVLNPRRISPQTLEMHIAVFRSRLDQIQLEEKTETQLIQTLLGDRHMGKFLDLTFNIDMDIPTIIGIPQQDQSAYFLMIGLTEATPDLTGEIPEDRELSDRTVKVETLKTVQELQPVYPVELREEGVEGTVGLQINIDEEGFVRKVNVTESLHPYLDYTTAQAIWQGKFDPVLHEGEPVPAVLDIKVRFSLETWNRREEKREDKERLETKEKASFQAKLQKILDKCAEYCQMLADSALNFVCMESIKETRYQFSNLRWFKLLTFHVPDRSPTRFRQIPMITRDKTIRNKYLSDYQLVKKGDETDERRLLLKENKEKLEDSKKIPDMERFTVLLPHVTAIKLLGKKQQHLFAYQLLKDDKIYGRNAFVIEAKPKPRQEGSIESAKIWVDKETYQIPRSETRGVPIEGYEDVLKDCVELNVTPQFVTTHDFSVEKNGIRFPNRTTILVKYAQNSRIWRGKRSKIKAALVYDNYRFFTVETKHKIIKKMPNFFFFNQSKSKIILKHSLKISPCVIRHFFD